MVDDDRSGGYDEFAFVAEFYDHVVPYAERPDVAFFVDMALAGGGPVLEVGCGTGRVLIPTARAGVDIHGLDFSGRMLQALSAKIALEPESVRSRVSLHQGDMRDFTLPQTFQLVTIPFRPFQHLLTVEDQISCLAAVHRHLAPGGRFVFDVFNPDVRTLGSEERKEEFAMESAFTMPDGRRVRRCHRVPTFDLANQVADCELIYDVSHADGREERLVHPFKMRYLFRFEVEHLLARCGFAVEAVYADYERTPYGERYPGELIFVTRRGDDRPVTV